MLKMRVIVLIPLNLKKAMNRFRFSARYFAYSFGSSTRRCGKHNLKSVTLKKLQNTVESCRFSRSGTARQNKYSFIYRFYNCFFLLFVINYTFVTFNVFNILQKSRFSRRRKFKKNLDSFRGGKLVRIYLEKRNKFFLIHCEMFKLMTVKK